MHILEQLGVALGLATLSGLNLYLTVLIAGLAIRFDWIHLAERFQSLEALSHPAVITVAAILFLLEFFADKVPWVDSLWDSVHTFIRPIGGTMVALMALGQQPSYVQVVAALLAGGAALTTHGTKAGTRLLINHSPEPVTNIAMSLGEDIAVVGGMVLLITKPIVALFVFSALLIFLWMIFPRLWRIIRSTLWLAWHKLRMPGKRETLEKPLNLQRVMNDELRELLTTKAAMAEDEVLWTVRALSGKCKGVSGLSPNLRGLIIGTETGSVLHFAATKGLRDRLFKIPLAEAAISVESKFLSENVVLDAGSMRAVFRFPRGESDVAETVALRIRQMIGQAREAVALTGMEAETPFSEFPATLLPKYQPAPRPQPAGESEQAEHLLPFPSVS
jgi:hypothetical protein